MNRGAESRNIAYMTTKGMRHRSTAPVVSAEPTNFHQYYFIALRRVIAAPDVHVDKKHHLSEGRASRGYDASAHSMPCMYSTVHSIVGDARA
jgi:hypothetical protein